MLDVKLERRDFLQPNGDVMEFVTFRFVNMGSENVDLDQVWLKVPITDSENQMVAIRDGLPGLPAAQVYPSDGGTEVIYVQPRGSVQVGSTRTIGIQLLRRQLANSDHSQLTFQDPIRLDAFDGLPVVSYQMEASVIFPKADSPREVLASGCQSRTSRTATWSFIPKGKAFHRICADWRLTPLPLATGRVDDAIADIHLYLGSDSAGTTPHRLELDALARRLQEAMDEWQVPQLSALGRLDGWPNDSLEQRQDVLRAVLEDALLGRAEVLRAAPSPRLLDNAPHVALDLGRQVRALLLESPVRGSVPHHLADVVTTILRFVVAKRRLGSTAWRGGDLNETLFQDHFHEFLVGHTLWVEREVCTGEGRVDFLLEGVPVELKAVALGKVPMAAIGKYCQQAADYVSNRGMAVGVLLVLDKSNREKEKLHQPHLWGNTRVDVIRSRPGLRDSSGTIVISIVVDAFPPLPSSLKGSPFDQ